MQVLTDWIKGAPMAHRPGVYLTAYGIADDPPGVARRWNGRTWLMHPGRPLPREVWPDYFRGLAFDPSAAAPEIDAEDGGAGWFIKEPR